MQLIKDSVYTYYFIKKALRFHLYHKKILYKYNKEDRLDNVVRDLIYNGFSVIENYWSKEKCDEVLKNLMPISKKRKNEDFKSGAYFRVKEENEKEDKGVYRLFHPDKEFGFLNELKYDKFINQCIDIYYGYPMYPNYMTYQHNEIAGNETRGYHVDGWVDEFKAFLYLEDVTLENGPFAYIRKSHKAHFFRYKNLIKDQHRNPETGFSHEDFKSMQHNEEYLTGKAGTLIIADVAGLHRGLPQVSAERNILYNNYFNKDEEIYPAL